MLSTSVDCFGQFGERKAWSRAIADRLNFNEIDAFRGYDTRTDPLSRLEIAAKLKKIKSCGNLLEFRAMPGDIPTVHNFQKCGQIAVCPVCAARAQAMRKKRFAAPIDAMASLCGHGQGGTIPRRAPRPARPIPAPGVEPFPLTMSAPWPGASAADSFENLHAYMITATIRPRETLRDGMDHLMTAWKRFRLMGQRRKEKRSRGEFGKVVGGIAKVEIKRGAGSGKWHPHIHALVFTREKLDYRTLARPEKVAFVDPKLNDREILLSKISGEWLNATDGDSYNVHIDNLRTFWERNHRARGKSFAESVREQAAEVLKYATKWNADPESGSAEFDAADFVEVVRTTYCRRLMATYGYFRRFPGSDFVGNESGDDLYWNIPGKPRPEIYAARWSTKGFSDLEKMPAPVFPDSDPLQPLINWETSPSGAPSVRENPRAIYLRAVAKINGAWRRRRSLVLKMANRAFMPIETERLLNIIRERATAELMDARNVMAPWFNDSGPPAHIMAAILQKYRESKEYSESLTRAFLEILSGPARTLARA